MKRFVLAVALGVVLVAPGVAGAQTTTTGGGYPPPSNCLNNSTVLNLGTVVVGGTISTRLKPVCPFVPGSTVNMNVNGGNGGTKIAGNDGAVPVNLLIQSLTTGLLNDPVSVPVACGNNNVTASGTSATGPTSITGRFNLSCAAAAAPTSNVAFTGANILRWSLGAAALIGIGALFVLGSRRRREAR
jgi:hypothetical protein